MNRNEIISSLKQLTDAERSMLESRLDNCSVRIVREGGVTEDSHAIRGPNGALAAMGNDETIVRVEYKYNGKCMLAA